MSTLLRRLCHPDTLAILFLLLLPVVLLWQGAIAGLALLPTDALFAFEPWRSYAAEQGVSLPRNDLIADMILQNYGWREFAKSQLLQGQLPLWNPYVFTGMPFMAQSQYGVLYPLSLPFFLVLPTAIAYAWFTALHLSIGGIGAYAYLRALNTGRWGALLAGAGFALAGVLVVSFQWPQVVSTMVWLPWLLLWLELLFQRWEAPVMVKASGLRGLSTPLLALLGALVVALQFLAGHTEMSFYLLFTAGAYTLFRLGLLVRSRGLEWSALSAAATAGLMVALGALLAGVQLAPFYELIQQNFRAGGSTLSEVLSYTLPKIHLLGVLAPDLFGNPTHHSYFDLVQRAWLAVAGSTDLAGQARSYPYWSTKNYVEATAYVGVLPVLLAAVALVLRRDRYTLFFAGLALFSLLLMFGSPLYGIFFFGLPGFDQLHSPFRWAFPFSFSVLVLAGRGLDALLAARAGRALSFLRVIGLLAAGMGLSVLAAMGLALAFGEPQVLAIAAGLRETSTALRAAFPTEAMLYSYLTAHIALPALLLAVSGGLVLWACRRPAPRLVAPLAVALLAADLLVFGWGFISFTPASLTTVQPKLVQWLQQQAEQENFRIASFGGGAVLPPNTSMPAGLQDVRGYDTVIPKQYVAFWELMEPAAGLPYSQINRVVRPETLTSPLFQLLNVRYLLSQEPITAPGYELAYDGEAKVYRNTGALPRSFAVFQAQPVPDARAALEAMRAPGFDPRQTVVLEGIDITRGTFDLPSKPATIASYKPTQVVVQVDMSGPGYLVLTDAYFAGWQAQDQRGVALPVLRADGAFRAVALEPGSHTITFRYAPESFRIGLYLSFVGLVLAALVGAYAAWRVIFREQTQMSGVRRVVKNSLTPLGAQLVARLVDFGFAVFMLRLLGPEQYGSYAFAVVLIGYFSIFTDFGLGTLITREVAREPGAANRYVVNTIALRLGLCLLAAPVLLGVALVYERFFGLSHEAMLAALLFMLSLIPASIAGALSAVFAARERMEFQAAMTIVTSVARVLAGLVALLSGWGIVGLGVASVVASTVNVLLFGVLFVRTYFVPGGRPEPLFMGATLRNALPLMLNSFLNSIFFRIDVMVLQPLRGAQTVGYYSTAYKFIDGLLMVSSFFTLALFPVMSRFAESAPERLLASYVRVLKGLLLFALPVAAGITVMAEEVVTLFFGNAYLPAAHALQVLIWFLPFSYVNGVTQYVLIALDQQRYLTKAFFAAALFNLVGNLLTVPAFGMEGAALMTILSEWVLMVPFLRGIYRHLGPLPIAQLLVRPCLAAAGMGLVLLAVRGSGLLLAVPVSAAVYTALLFALRTFDEEDRALLRGLLAR